MNGRAEAGRLSFSVFLHKGYRLALIFFSIVSLSVLITSCSTQTREGSAPVESRGTPPSRAINFHVVESGDTLYSIAWRYEIDYRELAQINGIGAPFVIRPGQRIWLSQTASVQSQNQSTPVSERNTTTVNTSPTSNSSTTVRSAPAGNAPVSVAPPVPESVEGWAWPLEGRIVTSFGKTDLIKGITLETNGVTDVKAAADGVVVYAGSGLRTYGNFIILKHSDLYLSAYAYNSELIAQEGDTVGQGQLIARSGQDQEGDPRLYFEIRRDGNPVDPVRYLPKR